MGLKLLLKRGGLLAAANWHAVALQFAAQTLFQILLAIPLVGAAILVGLVLGADPGAILEGGLRNTFTTIADALMAEPIALVAFVAAFAIVLAGGSLLMFLVKGGTVSVMLASDQHAPPIEREPMTIEALGQGSVFAIPLFIDGCQRFFRRYVTLGVALMIAYLVSGVAYVACAIYGYRIAGDGVFLLGWTLIGTLSVGLVFWITAINLVYLLLQIAIVADDISVGAATRAVVRFVRTEVVELSGVFVVVFGLVVVASVASWLVWSALALIAFVPLVGLAVVPLQIMAWLVSGLLFQYLGLTAMGAYLTLYRRHSVQAAVVNRMTTPAIRPVSAG